MKIVTSAQMAEIERLSERSGVDTDELMENAGLAVAETCRGALGHDSRIPDIPVLMMIGPGNNGGDGLVAGRHLSNWGARTTVYLSASGREPHPKAAELPGSVRLVRSDDDADLAILRKSLSECALTLDALLGTGSSRPISGHLSEQMNTLAEARSERPDLLLVAVDLPTGVSADTGEADPMSVSSDITVALGRPKIGHCAMPGAEFCGVVMIEDIGLPTGLDEEIDLSLITPEWARFHLPARPAAGHKGTFGKVLIVAGCRNYVGAALLASNAASRVGAGLVTAAVPKGIQMAVAAGAPQVTHLPMPETPGGGIASDGAEEILSALHAYDALVVGCGLGLDPGTGEMLSRLLTSDAQLPLTVVDADGLNLLSTIPGWHRYFTSPAILTPHLGEMSRLDAPNASPNGAERIHWARGAAQEWNKVVVLKGAHSTVADPNGKAMISPFANPGLATAGTGDVLAGAIGGLLAQGMSLPDAAALGVFLHGAAGETVRADLGEAGMVAGDLAPELPRTIKTLNEG